MPDRDDRKEPGLSAKSSEGLLEDGAPRLERVDSVGTTLRRAREGFGEDLRASRSRVFVFLKRKAARAVAQNETIPIRIPGAAGSLRVVIASGQSPCRTKPPQRQGRRGVLRTAGQHHVCITIGDHACAEPDAMG